MGGDYNNRTDGYSRRDAIFCVSTKELSGRQRVTAGDARNAAKGKQMGSQV